MSKSWELQGVGSKKKKKKKIKDIMVKDSVFGNWQKFINGEELRLWGGWD